MKKEHPEPKLRKLQSVLLWPQSCSSGDAGFVLGWTQQIGCCEQVLVAGIIKAEADVSYREQIETLEARVQQLLPCHCCSCDRNDAVADVCAGCIRRQLQGLKVIALYESSVSKSAERSDSSLPIIKNSKEFPFWKSNVDYAAQQVIMYQDVGRDGGFPMFQLTKFGRDSSLYLRFLRMEYAFTIMSELRQCTDKKERKGDSLYEPLTLHTILAVPKLLQNHSLLCRHLADPGSCIPILALPGAFRTYSMPSERVSGQCLKCGAATVIGVTHNEIARRRIKQVNHILRLTVDLAFGYLLGQLILYYATDKGSIQLAVHSYFDVLRRAMQWLNSFPVGFKLNEQLTAMLSQQVCSWLDIYEGIIGGIIRQISLIADPRMVQAAGVCLGGSTTLALLFDALHAGMSHVLILTSIFGRIFQAELNLLYALWCLFRGKKRNLLRRRTDTMEYDSTQLLFGTVMFVAALFLFTTALVYHVFFATIYLVILLCLSTIQLVYALVKCFPYGKLTQRALTDWFIIEVYLEHDETLSNEAIDVTSLRPRTKKYSSVIRDGLSTPMRSIARHMFATASCLLTGPPRGPMIINLFDTNES